MIFRGGSLCLLLAVAATFLVDDATALSTMPTAASASIGQTFSSAVFEGLSTTPLVRASDEQLVSLPSLWKSNTPFGIADDTAVCAFLRHYG